MKRKPLPDRWSYRVEDMDHYQGPTLGMRRRAFELRGRVGFVISKNGKDLGATADWRFAREYCRRSNEEGIKAR